MYVLCSYEPIGKIIDERWDHKLHRPLHAAAYHLNPPLHYEPTFRHDDPQVKEGLHMCMRRLVKDVAERKKLICNLLSFILLESFSLWKRQRTIEMSCNLENGGRCLVMKLQS